MATKFAHTSLVIKFFARVRLNVYRIHEFNCLYLQEGRTGFVAFKGFSIFVTELLVYQNYWNTYINSLKTVYFFT